MNKKEYIILQGFHESSGNYAISSIRLEDAEPIRGWRNDQITALRQSHSLTKEEQDNYFKSIILPSFSKKKPDQVLVRFTHNNELIGYGGLVHINWKDLRGEVSFLLETKRSKNVKKYCAEIGIFLDLLKRCAFQNLGLHKITTYSYAHRTFHVDAIEDAGFIREGILREDTKINDKWVDAILASCLKSEFEKP